MDDILVKVDRASMYNSLEVRAPFLDTSVVDFLTALPYTMKIHYGEQKYVLKKLMEGRLSPEIIYRKKKGFGIPVALWLCTELKPLVQEFLGTSYIQSQGIFEPKVIEKLVQDHYSHRIDNRKKIWTLLMFQLWWSHWYKKM